MNPMFQKLVVVLITIALLPALAGCAGSQPDSVEITQGTVLLDVRDQSEYQSGHLEDARLLSLNSGELSAALPDLDPDAQYVIYCRSGNRSAQAAALMKRAGFTDVIDLGSMSNAASATGLATVTQ